MAEFRNIHRARFLRITTWFQCGLLALAYLLGLVAGIDPLASLRFEWTGLFWGVAGVFPMFGVFAWLYYRPVGNLELIKRILIQNLGPLLNSCHWYDLLAIALMVGFSEELLFRGVLQPWMESAWGYAGGLLGSNLLFGLAHMVSPMYALLAGLTGLYLGWMMDVGGERNLLIPALIHAIYDFVAFFVVVWSFRQNR